MPKKVSVQPTSISVFLLGVLIFLTACSQSVPAASSHPRPDSWATPVPSEHLENLYRVDGKLWRSAQPDSRGMRELSALGITRVLNLRYFHSDDDEAAGTGLILYRVPMDAGEIRDEDVAQALRAIAASEEPILVHCWHGSDRTGTIIAMYRILFQGWTREAAKEEMIEGGYGFHSIYANIPEYIDSVSLEKIRALVDAP